MKKLSKIQINSERLMKEEDLLTLKGGDHPGGNGPCTCLCYNYSISPPIYLGYVVSATGNCGSDCRYAFGGFPVSGTCQD